MQLLARRALINLTKNALTTTSSIVGANNRASAFITEKPIIRRNNASTAVPTQKLLRFPAVPLNETMQKFLRSCEPLLTAAELEETKKAAKEFEEGEGCQLQKFLEKAAEKETNWLATRWLRTAYLQYRDPVTVHSSPGMSFPPQVFKNQAKYLEYTAKVIYILLKYKEMVDCGQLPVQKMGKLELDNGQFHRIFGTCRMPQPKEDALQYNPKSKHVVVIYKNYFYKLPVYASNGQIAHNCELLKQLTRIIEQSPKERGKPFGLLSTDNRDNWATSYAELSQHADNCKYTDIIQKSLFTVSLDECVDFKPESLFNVLCEQLIHGGGADRNSANRWMDKTIQVIVNPNGMSGFCYEHSPAEGQPIALMTDYVVKNLGNADFFKDGAKEGKFCAEFLNLESTPALDKHFEVANKNVNQLARDLQLHVLHYKNYGKGFMKKQKLSPDSFIQTAIQLAFFSMYKVPGAQYESAHLRIYDGGRTETIRSCTQESLDFSCAMNNEKVSNDERKELLIKAVNAHTQYTKMALMGKGVDRHLMGLRLMAAENNLPVPRFFSCPGVVKSATFRISTSQVASANVAFMSYGTLTHDGYGCCYNPRENDLFFAVSAWRSNKETDAQKYACAIENALADMAAVCESGAKSKL